MTVAPLALPSTPLQALTAYGAALAVLLALDALWLTVLMGGTYKAYLGELMLAEPKLVPAALFYLFYAVGLVVFAVLPALRAASPLQAALLGALLGAIAYATYDLSNLATLRGWPLPLTLIDIGWGTVLSCIVASAAYAAASRVG